MKHHFKITGLSTIRLVSFIITILASGNVISANIRIFGKVMSENDSTEIIGASCRLLAADNRSLTVQSDLNGMFSFDREPSEKFTLNIEAPGCSDYEITLEGLSNDIDLGTIYLSPANDLQELVVIADSRRESRGKTIVIPSATDVKASSDALSLLRKLQLDGLEVNPVNRSMSANGSGIVILINGIPSTQDDVNALNPKDISKVEYSRYVPARYADKGAGGFINISLKKRDDGGAIYIWGRGCPTTGFVDGNIRGSYHQGPSQFTLSYNPSWRSYNKVFDHSESSFIGDDFRVDLISDSRSPFYYLSNPINLKYIFRPNETLVFSATFNAGLFNDGRSSKGSTHDSLNGDYSNNSKSDSKSFTPSLDLYLRKDFNSNNSVEVEFVGTISSTDYRKTLTDVFENGENESYTTDTDNRRRSLISEISYVHSFNGSTEFSAGYQNTISGNENHYPVTEYKASLTENNNYVYAQISSQAGPVFLRASTGAKLFWMRNDLNRRHFIRNLSSALASWTINPMWSLTYQFNYSPSIPGLASLTDYPQQTSLYLISNGNPDLKVTDSFYNGLSLNFKKGIWSAAASFSHNHFSNPVYSAVTYEGDGKFLSNSMNFKSQQNMTGYLRLGVNGLAEMFGASINVYYQSFRAKGEDWRHSLDSFSGSVNLWWNKGPFTISYWRKLPGKSLWGTSVMKEENGDALDFQYSPNKHWTLDLGWFYMFSKKGTQYPSWNYAASNPKQSFRYIKNNANMICLSFTYQADFGSIFNTGRRSLNNRDNGSSLLRQ